jgi:ubiquinone/menaquinone biosynthesis C-methylase UbiE
MTRGETAFDEHIAAHYEEWYETQEGRRADTLEKAVLGWLLGGVPQIDSVLEIGCGTGHFSRWLDCRGLATVGLDLSAAMLAEAKVSAGVSLVQGKASCLPFADDTFDVTAFITTLEFLALPRQALVEALRVARRGVILGVLNRWSLLGLERRLRSLCRWTIYDAAHFYGVGELKRLLRSVVGAKEHIVWRTTLFPRTCPWSKMRLPWGGFIGMALVLPPSAKEVKAV